MSAQSTTDIQLKEASQLTGAKWSALVERQAGVWRVLAGYHLPKKNYPTLAKFISKAEVDTWLCGALSGGQSRSVSLPEHSTFEGTRLFAFPLKGGTQAILAGADQLDGDAQRIWRLVAMGMGGHQGESFDSEASASVAISLLVPDLDSENPYDLPRALARALESFMRLIPAQGGWLAIRRGDSLEVRAQRNAPSTVGVELPIEANTILRRMHRNLTPMVIHRDDALWSVLPSNEIKANTKLWVIVPIVIGQRLIGALAFWRTDEFQRDEWNRLISLVTQSAPAIETIITFAETASHLRRLALLNDFALTTSSGRNLNQIARHMFALLSRAFGTELIVLYLLSSDNQLVNAFKNEHGQMTSAVLDAQEPTVASLLSRTQRARLSNLGEQEHLPLYTEATSGLYIPLRFRNQTIGMLCVEKVESDAFNFFDESLIFVIASHLASLADYTRLREEAEGRARNLGLIHEVVQQVIGLTDQNQVAEITAELLARYFAYEVAAVFLTDLHGNLTIHGYGGFNQKIIKQSVGSADEIATTGIVGHVFRTGDSLVVNDISQDERYRSVTGWQAGSEMCVAIREGVKVLGVINVESSSRNSFNHNDFMALESLAGILASVVTNADQYQRLQVTISQLRSTQAELRERMEAQRQAENRLVQAAKLAAVGEMAAGIAHELNNPLTSVTGFTELAINSLPEGNESRTDLEMVMREARRARDVVRRLLDFARQSESTRANASLNEVITDVIALSRHLIQISRVELSIDLDPNLPWVLMDANQIKQVILNLVHNALQAMPSGGHMEISTSKHKRNNREWAMVAVRDTGVGISQAEQNRIFEPFFTTKGDKGGTGLGLSVTYGIVTDHAGQIDVESEPGVGSTFSVWLPLS